MYVCVCLCVRGKQAAALFVKSVVIEGFFPPWETAFVHIVQTLLLHRVVIIEEAVLSIVRCTINRARERSGTTCFIFVKTVDWYNETDIRDSVTVTLSEREDPGARNFRGWLPSPSDDASGDKNE